MNRCNTCGKFRKWDDLIYEGSTDYNGNEEEWTVCNICAPEEFEDAENKCAICEKLKKWDDLKLFDYHPTDRLDPREPESWYECKKCSPEKF